MAFKKILPNIFQYLNLLIFKRKFDICKYFSKKMHFFCIFFHFSSKIGIFEHVELIKK